MSINRINLRSAMAQKSAEFEKQRFIFLYILKKKGFSVGQRWRRRASSWRWKDAIFYVTENGV
jgi:hypothetical protein